MAFKRSGVRLPLSPPSAQRSEYSGLFSFVSADGGDKGSAPPMTRFSRQSGCTRLRLDTFVSRRPLSAIAVRRLPPLFISTNASIIGTEIVTAHSVRLFRPRFARPYDSPFIWFHHLPKDPNIRVFFYLGRMAEMLLNLRLVYLYVEGVAVIIIATEVFIPQRQTRQRRAPADIQNKRRMPFRSNKGPINN